MFLLEQGGRGVGVQEAEAEHRWAEEVTTIQRRAGTRALSRNYVHGQWLPRGFSYEGKGIGSQSTMMEVVLGGTRYIQWSCVNISYPYTTSRTYPIRGLSSSF